MIEHAREAVSSWFSAVLLELALDPAVLTAALIISGLAAVISLALFPWDN